MTYPAKIEGFEGQNIEAALGFWTAPKLLVNGDLAPRGSKRGEMLLTRNDGRQVVARWQPQLLGFDVPALAVDGKTINFVQPLKWYEMVWSAAPLILIGFGGVVGGIAGLLAFIGNTRIFRMNMTDPIKFVVSGAVSAAAVFFYLLIAITLSLLMNR